MKTLDELEAERPEDFRNPEPTPAEEARYQRQLEEMRIANEALPDEPIHAMDAPDVPEEEEEEEEE